MQTMILRKGAEKRLKQGHLWVYSNEVDVKKTPLKGFSAGEQCSVESHSGQFLGVAFVNPNTLICGRLFSRDKKAVFDRSLFAHRLNIALSLRDTRFEEPCYRLVYGDSDGMPGLVVDRFGDDVVVQISIAGMEALKEDILAVLEKKLKPRSVLFKNDGKMRESEGLESYVEQALGDLQEAELVENGVRFLAPVEQGQKTGWFYDHRLGRAALKPYVKGKKVLDLFSYVGGWGVQAAAFGASEVTCVDSSRLALDYVHKNAELNGVQDQVTSIEGDVFEVCKALREQGERFDVVIADPPAFIPRRKDQKAGELAYQRLNQIAMRLLNKDGLLVSGSCSMHLQESTLLEIVRKTGRALEKELQLIERFPQGPDHPIVPAIPETNYLKAMYFRVLPQS